MKWLITTVYCDLKNITGKPSEAHWETVELLILTVFLDLIKKINQQ